MTLYNLTFNPYEVNTYILCADDGQCAIIDPGCCSQDEQKKLAKFIADKGLSPVWLINTHGHYDHIIGNSFVCRTWAAVKSAAHRDDLFLMENGYMRAEIFGFPVEKPPTPDVFLNEGDVIDFGDATIQVLHVPGHSPGSIVLNLPDAKIILTGDVLFNGSIGRTDLPGANHNLLIKGIKEKILTLVPETVVYTGHGPKTTVGKEKDTNPFLK